MFAHLNLGILPNRYLHHFVRNRVNYDVPLKIFIINTYTQCTLFFEHTLYQERRIFVLEKIKFLIGQPIGVSLKNGLSVSGVLCDANEDEILLLEYMYQEKFIQNHYDFKSIKGIYMFPYCKEEYIN